MVVTVQENGFKPGTFSSSSDYNRLTGVRKSRASGILLYTFRVYAPEGYRPQGEADLIELNLAGPAAGDLDALIPRAPAVTWDVTHRTNTALHEAPIKGKCQAGSMTASPHAGSPGSSAGTPR